MPSVDAGELVTRRSWVTGFLLHCSRGTLYQDQKQLSAREATTIDFGIDEGFARPRMRLGCLGAFSPLTFWCFEQSKGSGECLVCVM
jgi:hypothetical protein